MSIEEFRDNFIKLGSSEIVLHNTIEDDNIFVFLLDFTTCYIYDLRDVLDNERLRHRFVYDASIQKTVYMTDYLRFSKYYCDSIVFPFLNWNHPCRNLNAFQEHSYSFMSNDFLRANFITRLEKCDNKYYMVNYGSKKILQRILSNKKSDYKSRIFIDILYNNIKRNILVKSEDELACILSNVPKNESNVNEILNVVSLLKDDITLYEYQKNDIKWMMSIKERVDNNENSILLEKIIFHSIHLDGNDYLLYNDTILPHLNHWEHNFSNPYEIKYYGGNIISEVGLGKTLIVLSYIFESSENLYHQFVEFDINMCNYFYKRGKNKMFNCNKEKCEENELYCKEHANTLFIDKRHVLFKNLDGFNLRDCIVNRKNITGQNQSYFKTNASIILCPNQLCDQWVREYYEKFKQTFDVAKRVLLIITYDQYKNLSFGDILFADIIIISYNFLLNINYLKKTGYNTYRNVRKSIITILDELDSDESITCLEDILNVHHEELNLLDNYVYNGVYLDENHEILDKQRSDLLKLLIHSFQSNYKWNISATPFSKGMTSFMYNINCITNASFDIDIDNIYNLHEETIKKLGILYRRNTRESIQNEFVGNIITENVKLLEFTEQERSIYDAHLQGTKKNNDFLIKLCCDTSIDAETRNLVKNCKTLDEIQKVILDHNKKKLGQLKNKMKRYTDKIDEFLLIVERGYILDEKDNDGEIFESIEAVKVEISILRRRITHDKKEYDSINRTYMYLKNVIDTIKEKETCPICLEDIPIDQISITKCGHKFCKDCINEFIDEVHIRYDDVKCPKCNVIIQVSDIYLLKDIEPVQHNDDKNELTTLINKIKSTKIGNIIYYIKREMKEHDKCILFSQWNNILVKIGNILKQENINVLYCSGTVYQKKRAIHMFQNDIDKNIICLSSENCASGINLTSANKIILIEPIYGNKDYRKDIENQAIGRADRIGQKRPIEIVRFIIKDTIEEEILNENNASILEV